MNAKEEKEFSSDEEQAPAVRAAPCSSATAEPRWTVRVQLHDLQLKQAKAKAKAQEREEDDMYF